MLFTKRDARIYFHYLDQKHQVKTSTIKAMQFFVNAGLYDSEKTKSPNLPIKQDISGNRLFGVFSSKGKNTSSTYTSFLITRIFKMKYQVNSIKNMFSIGLAALFLFTASMAQAEVIFHEETPVYDATNDSQAGRILIPSNNDVQVINGTINGDNDVDQWGFEVNRSTRAIQIHSSGARVIWVLDKNKNLRSDPEDRNIILTRGNEGHTLLVRNGPRIVAVVSGSKGQNYSLIVSNVSKPAREITATFINAKALDKFDGRFAGKADFRAKVTFVKTEEPLRGIPSSQKVVSNNNNPNFNVKAFTSFSTATRKIPIVLSLVDQDPGKDDVADISPNSTKRSLETEYDAFTETVFGPDGEKLGKRGQVITVQGTDSNRKAQVSFRIDTKDPINAF